MKRKFRGAIPEYPSRTLNNGGAGTRTAASGSPGSRSKRRVRFGGILDEEPRGAAPPPFLFGAMRSYGEDEANGPKTSEYAFFKRLREGGGGRGGCGRSKCRDVVDGPIFSRPERNISDAACNKDGRSLFLDTHQSMTPRAPVPSRLPLHVATDKSALDRRKGDAILAEIYGDLGVTVLHSDHRKHEDIFSEKRRKLHEWVAENSSPDVAGLCSKGCHFVSVLLKRLFPESSKDEALALLNKKRRQTDIKDELVTKPESDIYHRNYRGMPIRNNLQQEYGQKPDRDLGSSFSFGHDLVTKGREFGNNTKLLYEPRPDIHLLNYYWMPARNNVRLECGPFSDIGLPHSLSPGYDLLDKTAPAPSNLVDLTFEFCSKEHRLGSSSFNELGKRYDFNGSLCDAEPNYIPLEDFNVMSSERQKSPNYQSTQLSLVPRSAVSWVENERQNVDGFSLSRSSQPLVSHVPEEPPVVLLSKAIGSISCGLEGHFVEAKDDRRGYLDSLLPFSSMTNHDHFNEHSGFPARIGSSGLFRSPRKSILLISKELLEENPHPGSDSIYRFGHGCNIDEKWLLQISGSSSDHQPSFAYHALDLPRTLEISSLDGTEKNVNSVGTFSFTRNSDHLGEDVTEIDGGLSFYHIMSDDKAVPLLLDGQCYHQSEGKWYTEDSEGVHI